MWTSLDGWVTPATRAFLAAAADAPPGADAAAGAPEPPPAADMSPAEAAAAARRAPPLAARDAEEVRSALAGALDRAMAALRRDLGMRVPVAALDTTLRAMLRTFAFRGALPALVRRDMRARCVLRAPPRRDPSCG
jgi:hypothetical protein